MDICNHTFLHMLKLHGKMWTVVCLEIGVKIVNLHTNKLVKILGVSLRQCMPSLAGAHLAAFACTHTTSELKSCKGKVEQTERFLGLALYQGKAQKKKASL